MKQGGERCIPGETVLTSKLAQDSPVNPDVFTPEMPWLPHCRAGGRGRAPLV